MNEKLSPAEVIIDPVDYMNGEHPDVVEYNEENGAVDIYTASSDRQRKRQLKEVARQALLRGKHRAFRPAGPPSQAPSADQARILNFRNSPNNAS